MREATWIEVSRPLWHTETRAALVAFAAGAVLGDVLPYGAALVALPALWVGVALLSDRLYPRQ